MNQPNPSNNLSSSEIAELIKEVAKQDPYILTNIIRQTGCWVYLVTSSDIVTYAKQMSDKDITEETAKEALLSVADNDDMIDYNMLCDDVLNEVDAILEEKNKETK